MLPIRWDPLRSLTKDLGSMHREMDELFRRTLGWTTEAPGESGYQLAPAVNTYTKGNTYFVEAELPGVSKADLDVSIDGNVLTLRGERKAETETKEEDYFIHESQYGSFIRRLALPEGVDCDRIRANFEDGLLRVSMPIEKKIAAGRKVQIEGAESGRKEKRVH
jgi:HSP20 family protein